jgi:peroxiredoxin
MTTRNEYQLGFPSSATRTTRWPRRGGVCGERTKEGRTYGGIIRSSFLVDADGRIREAGYQAAPERTVALALEAISAA